MGTAALVQPLDHGIPLLWHTTCRCPVAGAAAQAAVPGGNGSEPPTESEWEEVEPPPASVPKLGANSSPTAKPPKQQALVNGAAGRPGTPAQVCYASQIEVWCIRQHQGDACLLSSTMGRN
jgi:hypothetical protein